MEAEQRDLTSREKAYFEHVRQAKEEGLTLKAYCEKLGMNARNLYGIRRDLVSKGILPRTLRAKEPKTKGASRGEFVAVRVADAGTGGAEVVCRVRHPSGWTIECGRLPEAAWLASLIKGAEHAPA